MTEQTLFNLYLSGSITHAQYIGNLKQLNENVASLNNLDFTKSELTLISKKAREGNINLWLASSSH